jgi:hypothetical protein
MKLKTFLLSAALLLGMLTTVIAQTAQHDSIRVKVMKNENGVITDIDTAVAIAQHDQLLIWLSQQGIEMPPPPPMMEGDSMKHFMIVKTIEMDSMPDGGLMRIPPPPTPPGAPAPPNPPGTFIMRTPPPPPGHEGEVMIIVCDTTHRKECRKVVVENKTPGTAKTQVITKDASPNNELVVYPNPSSGHITIDVNMPGKEKAVLTVTDMDGKTVFTEELPASDGKITKEIDLTKNGKGMYSIRLSKGGKVIVEQVVVE